MRNPGFMLFNPDAERYLVKCMIDWLADKTANRSWWVLLIWAVVLAVGLPLAGLAPGQFSAAGDVLEKARSVQVIERLAKQFGLTGQETSLIVSNSTLPSTNPDFLNSYDRLVAEVRQVKDVLAVQRFDAASVLSRTGLVKGKFVTVTLVTTGVSPLEQLRAIRKILTKANNSQNRFLLTGPTAVNQDFGNRSEADVRRSESSALPLVALVLLGAFGALVAASLPILVGLLSITTTLAGLWVMMQFTHVSSLAGSVITIFGLGAGIDYALLIVNRFREELERGANARQAARITTRTAGRSVVFSGVTVAIAMLALLIPNLSFVRSMGLAGLMIIFVTVISSITVLPAALALLGDRVNMPRRLRRQFKLGQGNRVWAMLAAAVMRRPWHWALVTSTITLVLAFPALGLRLGTTGAFGLASNVESRAALELVRPLELGGTLDTFELILDLDQTFDGKSREAFKALHQRLTAWPDVRLVISPFTTLPTDNTTQAASASPSASPLSGLNAIQAASRALRSFQSPDRRSLHLSVIPAEPVLSAKVADWIDRLELVAHELGFKQVLIGGSPVASYEYARAISDAMPLAIGVVFVVTFIALAWAFGSLVIPLKSILMNSLTVAAAYGVITMVFQNGWFADLIQAPVGAGVIDASLPLVIFAITFGLSMDYEVFLLSRIQEAHLQGMDTKAAVQIAIERTAGVITSAALVMLCVFTAFLQGEVVANKVIGLGLTVAVALDATIIRLMLVPAVMVLAGKWNWWLPAPLRRWLPSIKLEH